MREHFKAYNSIGRMNLSSIPPELKQFPNWVAWRYEQTDKPKPAKVPYSPITGRRADSTDGACWAPFEQAVQFYQAHNLSGIGFMFGESPFAGVDFDQLDTQAKEVIAWLNSYTETSPGGQGAHVIVRGSVLSGRRKDKIELYSDSRYFTVTGEGSGDIRAVDLQPLYEFLGRRNASLVSGEGPTEAPARVPDDDVYRQASVAQNSEKFLALWSGALDGHGNDHSAADQALMNILAFYTQSPEQLKRLFRTSALGQRTKANREDYLDRTIQKAFDQQIPMVDFKWEPRIASVTAAPNPEGITHCVASSAMARPPGLVGDIADFIYRAAPVPVQEIAIAGALGLMAGICSRSYSISNKGLNQYIVLLAKTGRGKEAMASGISRLMRAVANQEPAANAFLGPGRIASGQALLKRLSGPLPTFVSVVGEVGHWMQELCGPKAGQNEKKLREIVLDVWGKSGPNDTMQPLIYSDSTKNTQSIRAPGFSILGESTFSQFYEGVDESIIEMGLLPRLLVIEYLGERVPFNEAHEKAEISLPLQAALTELCSYSLKMNSRNEFMPVQLAADTIGVDRAYRGHCEKQINAQKSDGMTELWNRAHMKVLKTAALLAVGVSPYQPVISKSEYEWAMQLVEQGIQAVVSKFDLGEVGAAGHASRQDNELKKLLDDYISRPWKSFPASYRVREDWHANKAIQLEYIQCRLYSRAAFKIEARRGIADAVKNAVTSGRLKEIVVNSTNGTKITGYMIDIMAT